jgi:hypothetical protein
MKERVFSRYCNSFNRYNNLSEGHVTGSHLAIFAVGTLVKVGTYGTTPLSGTVPTCVVKF